MNRTLITLGLVSILCLAPVTADSFSKGEELYLFNKPSEAAVFLEQAILEDPSNYTAFLHLGISRQQLGQYDKAIKVFKSALDKGIGDAGILSFNMANASMLAGDVPNARLYYQQAAAVSPSFPKPYVNLGNLEVQQLRYPDAIAAYKQFIVVAPDDPLVPDVVKMIGLLEEEIVSQENEKKAEEERKLLLAAQAAEAEKQRLAQEEEKRKAEEKRKLLMDSVFDSLSDLAGTGDTLTAGNEDVKEAQDSMERDN